MAPVHYHAGQFPPGNRIDWQALVPLVGPAASAVARYDIALSAMPDPQMLLSPLAMQEAVLSSRIEGIHADLTEVLAFEAGLEAEAGPRRDDIEEVLLCRAAMREAESLLKELPFCQRIVRAVHGVLLSSVRGTGKSPGDYRRISNWIGVPGSTPDTAIFVPISAEGLAAAMSDWERYAHRDDIDRILQIAILHAEFEALHPFLDGNGRLGRMMVPLLLWQWGITGKPGFFVSGYFESRRDAYYDGLLSVSRDGDWTGWCRFFLEAVRQQAEDNRAKADVVLALRGRMKKLATDAIRSKYAIRAMDRIFRRPVFASAGFAADAGVPERTARRILAALVEAGILREIQGSSGRRGAILAFPDLLNIAEGRRPH